MSLRSKHQELAAKYHWLIPIVVPLLAGYLGYGEYEKYEARQDVSAPTVEVTISTPRAGPPHRHGTVVSRGAIKDMIANQHAKDLRLFKQREVWE